MFCITHSDPSALQLRSLTVWPEDTNGNRYSWELNINIGKGDQNLVPTIMDIIGTACPFIDTSKFKRQYLSSIDIAHHVIGLSFSDGDRFADEVSTDFTIPICTLLDVFDVEKLTLSICFYRTTKNGDTELCEIYDIAFDEDDDAAKVSIVTPDQEIDAFLVEEDLYVTGSYDDFDNEEFDTDDDDDDDDEDEDDNLD